MRTLLRSSRVITSALLLTAAAAWPLAQQQAPTQPPRFKAGVEVMRIEMTVLDRRTREPIRGLTAKDFVVTVNGEPQEVVALSEVVTTAPSTTGAAWTRESPIEVATNTPPPADQQRLIVIIMDDVYKGSPYNRSIGKAAANRIVDELGPHDLAAIIFPQFNQHAQDFTGDRTALRRAIQTYNPQELYPILANAMTLGVLRRAGTFLGSISGRRRAIFYITNGPSFDQSEEDPLGREQAEGLANAMRPVSSGSRLSHVPVYPISVTGLAPYTRSGAPPANRAGNENLHTIARASGGRAIADNNAPDREVPAIFQELSSYYVLAYAATFPMDGKLRRLSVDVNHPRAMVEPDDLVLTTPREAPSVLSVTAASGAFTGLVSAIAGPLPTGALPLQLVVTPLADTGSTRATAVMTLGILVPAGVGATLPGGKDQAPVEVRIFDGEGRKQITHRQLTVNVTSDPQAAALAEVALRFDLKPGRYNVRIGAGITSTGVSGGVFMTFTVPDFEKEALSLSGVAIGRAAVRGIGGRDALGGILPFAPTVERSFSRADVVGALVRIHQSARRPPSDIALVTTITSAAGVGVSRSTSRFAAAQFDATRSAEQRTELALSGLSPGDYLLTFTAVGVGGATAKRDVQFTVR